MIYRVLAENKVIGHFDYLEQASDVAREYATEHGHCALLDETGKQLYTFQSDVARQEVESEAVNNSDLWDDVGGTFCEICGIGPCEAWDEDGSVFCGDCGRRIQELNPDDMVL